MDNNQLPVDMHKDGLLWLINKAVFHPRGFALAHVPGTDTWTIQGDGTEPWHYEPTAIDNECFAHVEALFALAKQMN